MPRIVAAPPYTAATASAAKPPPMFAATAVLAALAVATVLAGAPDPCAHIGPNVVPWGRMLACLQSVPHHPLVTADMRAALFGTADGNQLPPAVQRLLGDGAARQMSEFDFYLALQRAAYDGGDATFHVHLPAGYANARAGIPLSVSADARHPGAYRLEAADPGALQQYQRDYVWGSDLPSEHVGSYVVELNGNRNVRAELLRVAALGAPRGTGEAALASRVTQRNVYWDHSGADAASMLAAVHEPDVIEVRVVPTLATPHADATVLRLPKVAFFVDAETGGAMSVSSRAQLERLALSPDLAAIASSYDDLHEADVNVVARVRSASATAAAMPRVVRAASARALSFAAAASSRMAGRSLARTCTGEEADPLLISRLVGSDGHSTSVTYRSVEGVNNVRLLTITADATDVGADLFARAAVRHACGAVQWLAIDMGAASEATAATRDDVAAAMLDSMRRAAASTLCRPDFRVAVLADGHTVIDARVAAHVAGDGQEVALVLVGAPSDSAAVSVAVAGGDATHAANLVSSARVRTATRGSAPAAAAAHCAAPTLASAITAIGRHACVAQFRLGGRGRSASARGAASEPAGDEVVRALAASLGVVGREFSFASLGSYAPLPADVRVVVDGVARPLLEAGAESAVASVRRTMRQMACAGVVDYFGRLECFEDICGDTPGADACCTPFDGTDCLGEFDEFFPAVSTVATWVPEGVALRGVQVRDVRVTHPDVGHLRIELARREPFSAVDFHGEWSRLLPGLDLEFRGDGTFVAVSADVESGPISGRWEYEVSGPTFASEGDPADPQLGGHGPLVDECLVLTFEPFDELPDDERQVQGYPYRPLGEDPLACAPRREVSMDVAFTDSCNGLRLKCKSEELEYECAERYGDDGDIVIDGRFDDWEGLGSPFAFPDVLNINGSMYVMEEGAIHVDGADAYIRFSLFAEVGDVDIVDGLNANDTVSANYNEGTVLLQFCRVRNPPVRVVNECSGYDAACDDGNACTRDICIAADVLTFESRCAYVNICCNSDSDCNDSIAGTQDACEAGVCRYNTLGNPAYACLTDNDCGVAQTGESANPCFSVTCHETANTKYCGTPADVDECLQNVACTFIDLRGETSGLRNSPLITATGRHEIDFLPSNDAPEFRPAMVSFAPSHASTEFEIRVNLGLGTINSQPSDFQQYTVAVISPQYFVQTYGQTSAPAALHYSDPRERGVDDLRVVQYNLDTPANATATKLNATAYPALARYLHAVDADVYLLQDAARTTQAQVAAFFSALLGGTWYAHMPATSALAIASRWPLTAVPTVDAATHVAATANVSGEIVTFVSVAAPCCQFAGSHRDFERRILAERLVALIEGRQSVVLGGSHLGLGSHGDVDLLTEAGLLEWHLLDLAARDDYTWRDLRGERDGTRRSFIPTRRDVLLHSPRLLRKLGFVWDTRRVPDAVRADMHAATLDADAEVGSHLALVADFGASVALVGDHLCRSAYEPRFLNPPRQCAGLYETVSLYDRLCGDGSVDLSMSFTDQSPLTLHGPHSHLNCSASPVGSCLAYRPRTPQDTLSTFTGADAEGLLLWDLVVRDDAAGDTGSLNAWTLDLCFDSETCTLPDPEAPYVPHPLPPGRRVTEGNCSAGDYERGTECPLGCDGRLLSGLTWDDCGVCGGDGSTCIGCDVELPGSIVDDCNQCSTTMHADGYPAGFTRATLEWQWYRLFEGDAEAGDVDTGFVAGHSYYRDSKFCRLISGAQYAASPLERIEGMDADFAFADAVNGVDAVTFEVYANAGFNAARGYQVPDFDGGALASVEARIADIALDIADHKHTQRYFTAPVPRPPPSVGYWACLGVTYGAADAAVYDPYRPELLSRVALHSSRAHGLDASRAVVGVRAHRRGSYEGVDDHVAYNWEGAAPAATQRLIAYNFNSTDVGGIDLHLFPIVTECDPCNTPLGEIAPDAGRLGHNLCGVCPHVSDTVPGDCLCEYYVQPVAVCEERRVDGTCVTTFSYVSELGPELDSVWVPSGTPLNQVCGRQSGAYLGCGFDEALVIEDALSDATIEVFENTHGARSAETFRVHWRCSLAVWPGENSHIEWRVSDLYELHRAQSNGVPVGGMCAGGEC